MGKKRMAEIIALADDIIPGTGRMEKHRFARIYNGICGGICLAHILAEENRNENSF